MLRVLNHLTWKTFAEFMHLSTVRSPCCAALFKEVDEPLHLNMSELCLSDEFLQGNSDVSEGHFRVMYEVTEVPISLPFQKPPADKPNPKQGIGLMSWSKDSRYIYTRNDSMPTALWIWDIHHLELAAILVQKDPIRAAAWDPTCTRLVLCTGSSHLYMWTPSGACCVSNPLSPV
ncbi:WD REPEAT PROTEIN 8-RELATED [Salix purpurea]|uniref:WD REPEAT PROTEIN 8-RELATED n=1 Tax=Salix purpurea TaxID=77065 RepID=A0A9Q0QFD9_SALPP|nr:WD REPEAT PROTEIN 8-RELATED [Salix purpurea]